MKKKKTLLVLSLSLVGIALVLIAYSLFLIIGSQMRANDRINEWDMLMNQQSSATSTDSSTIESNQVSSIPSSVNDSSGGNNSISPTPTKAPVITYKPELFGLITFPTIDSRKVVVVNGTTNQDLRGAAGHAKYTPNPGEIGNCIVFGHRDGVFRGFSKLKIGDKIIFKTLNKEFTYNIINLSITEPNSELIHKKYYDQSILTLVTCYPFNYVGAAPFRYAAIAELVP